MADPSFDRDYAGPCRNRVVKAMGSIVVAKKIAKVRVKILYGKFSPPPPGPPLKTTFLDNVPALRIGDYIYKYLCPSRTEKA